MADSLIYNLCKAVGNQFIEEACLLHGVPEEAKKMKENLKKITAVLKAAEQKEMESNVKMWLSDLKNVAYDIEDVLDDWRIAELQRRDESGTSQQRPNSKAEVLFSFISSLCFSFRQVKSRRDLAQRIKAINERLGEIGEAKNKFNFPTCNIIINERPERQAASAYRNYAVLRTQRELKATVIEKLVRGGFQGNVANGNRIPIISLVGMGGIGKTTLARLVYHDDSVEGHFSKTIWVDVSKPFNELNVIKAIAERLHLDLKNDSTKDNVLPKIDDSISGLKFLLVLDDVWEDSEGEWRDILGCLGKGDQEGSRILMTTRNSEFSKKMGAGIVSVEELCAEDAWSLFSYYAFTRDSGHREEVEDIAAKLAEKCHGLPLALEVLGRHMTTKSSRREWDDVLRSELWKTEFGNRVFNSFAVSYLELPSAAKRCFAFCSVYPKDTIMSRDDLIRLWMAQGYLQGGKGDQMEVLGEWCFESLERRSFIRVSEIHSDESADVKVTMHDLVHDFAHYLSDGEAAILDPSLVILDGCVNSEKIRHLAIGREAGESKFPYSTFDYTSLRTLFLSIFSSAAVIEAVCSNKSYIRALDIQSYFNSTRGEDIGKLVHLRYLRLGANNLTVLPKEICGLPFLQTLDVSQCFNVKTLPDEIGRLTSLRHLLLSASVPSLPKGLGKLSSLRTLNYFSCSGLDNDGCNSIEDLRGLNNLRGELRLKNLNNVANVDEAARADLHMKIQIRKLCLEFGNGDASLQLAVLEALQPAKESIEILEIWQHRGRRCPRWIGKMRYLKEVLLQDVSMEYLPEMGMLRFLEKLSIRRAHEVNRVGAEFFGKDKPNEVLFPRLRTLQFYCMSQWSHWEAPDVTTTIGDRVTIMPSLRCLIIDDCELLQTLPRFLEHVPLESLELSGKSLPLVEAAEIDYPNGWQIGDILLPQTIKHIQSPYLTLRIPESEVSVHGLYDGITIHTTAVPRYIIDMTYLRVINLNNIEDESLPSFGLLPSLLELNIWDAHNVGQVGDEFLGISSNNTTAPFVVVFPRLEKLTFGNMGLWQKWVDPVHGGNINLSIMPSLCYLQIFDCKILKSLPHFFDSVPLRKLEVMGNEDGDMVKIRNSSRMDEATACKTIIKSAAALPQPDLREITLSGVKNDWVLDWAKYCKGLRKLSLQSCSQKSVGCLPLLSLLESIEILRDISRRDESGDIRRRDESIEIISGDIRLRDTEFLECLLHLDISFMDDLDDISDICRTMRKLRSLSIRFCPRLRALPRSLSWAPLEELQIAGCPGLKTWWINEAGEDWRNWKSNIPIFNFPDLETEDESL